MSKRKPRNWDDVIDVYVVVGLLVGWLVLVAILYGVAPANADERIVVEVPITDYHGDPGDVIPIDSIDVPAGLHCEAELDESNNTSDHDGTDVLVGPLTFADVEQGSSVHREGSFTSTGDPVVIAVRIGPDGVISAGLTVGLDCHEPTEETTTTTAPPPPGELFLTVAIDCIRDTFVVTGTTDSAFAWVAVNVNGTEDNIDLIDGAFEETYPRGELNEGAVSAWLIEFEDGVPSGILVEADATIECPPEGGVPTGGGALADEVLALDHPHPPPRPWYSVGADVWIALGLASLAAAALVLLGVRSSR